MSNFISQKLYKELRKEKKQIDGMMWFANILGPVITIPQVALLYVNQSSENISLITWSLYLVVGLSMFTYAFIHKIRPLFYGQLAFLMIYTLMVIGILLYD